jgi:predicted SAM-dependent methyltransferase
MSRFDLSKALAAGPVRVHLGGEVRAPGWININPKHGPHVDIRGDHRRLALFPPDSVSAIYASHVVEHLDPRTEMTDALALFLRVLRPGGQLLASVPDLPVLCRFYCDASRSAQDRGLVMRMMFGGHIDEFDVHHSGFDEEGLRDLLLGAGFAQVRRVDDFGLFEDTSLLKLYDVPISLNVVATKKI